MLTFLSYPSERIETAREVFAFAKSLGLDIWFDKESLIGGQEWDRVRAEAQDRADATVLLFSTETGTRAGVIQREVRAALRRQEDQPQGHTHLILLRLDDVRPPAELARYQWIDLFDDGWKIRLSRALELRYVQLGQPVPEGLARFISETAKDAPTVASLKAEMASGEVSANFKRYLLEGPYWEFVNAVIVSEVYRGYFDNLRGIRAWTHGWGPSDWTMDVAEVFRSGEILSLSFAYSSYYSGTPHPNHGIITRAFGGSNLGLLEITDLLDTSDATFRWLADFCERDLRRQFSEGGDGSGFSLEWYLEEFGWKVFSDFTFTDRFLSIEFTPHGVFPHAMGMTNVEIPWGELAGRFGESIHGSEFALTLGLQTTGPTTVQAPP